MTNQTKEAHPSKIRKRTDTMLVKDKVSDDIPTKETVNTSDSQNENDFSPPLKKRKKGSYQPTVVAVSLVKSESTH